MASLTRLPGGVLLSVALASQLLSMNTKKKVLYISQEVTPYLHASYAGDLCRELPAKVQEGGFEARTFMPKYGCINERRNQLHEVIRLSGLNLPVDDADHPLIIKVATLQSSRMQVYFIDNDDYFHHHVATDIEIRQTPEENDERLIFFTRGTMETVKKLRWEPFVVHCSGWVTALTPIYLKKMYADDPTFASAKVVYALFNDRFDGTLDPRFAEKLLMDQLEGADIATLGDGPVDWLTLNKLAIDYADGVIVSQEGVDPALVEYAQSKGKPVLDYHDPRATGTLDAAPVIDFYHGLG